MKKILISVFLLLGTFSMASAEIGVKVGISGTIGLFEATGFETEDGEKVQSNATGNDKAETIGAMGSIFIEKTLGFLPGPLGRLSLGYDHVTHEIQTGTSSRRVTDLGAKGLASRKGENKASATIDNINTVYLTANITDWLYVKAGKMSADVQTTESLVTGSKYGDSEIDGDVFGLGVQGMMDNGMFFRVEYNDISLDGETINSTNTANKINLDSVSGEAARISVGKSF